MSKKISFLNELIHWIKHLNKSINSIIFTKLCAFSFTFKKVRFDISIVCMSIFAFMFNKRIILFSTYYLINLILLSKNKSYLKNIDLLNIRNF